MSNLPPTIREHQPLLKMTELGSVSGDELWVISTIEKACAALSMVGSAFIIVSFLCSSAFRKPINRLLFMTSIGNLLGSMAAAASRKPTNDTNSIACQLQAFVIQMFLPADAFWSMAMALNVYFVFYWRFDDEKLRKMELIYFAICYGIPFTPAFIYLWVKSQRGVKIYGDATLWCWIAAENSDFLRIATFYAPVWFAIFVSGLIYVRAGSRIFKKWRQLSTFSSNCNSQDLESAPVHSPEGVLVTSDVTITTHIETDPVFISTNSDNVISLDAPNRHIEVWDEPANMSTSMDINDDSPPRRLQHSYSVEIAANKPKQDELDDANDADVIHPQPLEPHPSGPEDRLGTSEASAQSIRAMWAYAKIAMLFFIAMTITWIPSSANRVYSMLYPGYVNLKLEYTSSAVLPLQGVWNALLYVVANHTAARRRWKRLKTRLSDTFERTTMWLISRVNSLPTPGRQKQEDEEEKVEDRPWCRGHGLENLRSMTSMQTMTSAKTLKSTGSKTCLRGKISEPTSHYQGTLANSVDVIENPLDQFRAYGFTADEL